MRFWFNKILLSTILSSLGAFATAEILVLPVQYGGLKLVESKELAALAHPVLLSAPKRINNALRIEKQVQINGLRSDYLYRVKSGYDLDEAFSFYKEFIVANGSIEFECKERACGTSTDWANKVFSQPQLAGRDSNQTYVAGRVNAEGLQGWLSVYAVLNVRRDEYVYVSFIPQKPENLLTEFRRGRLFLGTDISNAELEALSGYLAKNSASQLVLLSYHRDLTQSQEQNVVDSNAFAKPFYEVLVAGLKSSSGLTSDRVVLKNMGVLGQAPSSATVESWMYLYLLD